ncbi:MAG TPA: transporter substrate-binding domain-containing protein [Thermoleophilaceae bacterium]
MRPLLLLVAIAAAALAGCQYPRDVEGTLDRVEGGTMRVGVSDNEPWVDLDGSQPSGVEPEILRGFADRVHAKVQWVRGDSEELVEALESGQLDVVIAGITRTSEYRRKVGLTRPYVDTELLLAHPRGQDMPEEKHSVRVAVEADSQAAGLLDHKTDYGLLEVDSLKNVKGPALVWDYWLDDLDLESTGEDLIDEEHCIAVRFGENAFLVELERYLLDRQGEWRDLVNREGRP